MQAASANFVHCNCVNVNVIRRSGSQPRVDGINASVCCTQYILSHYAQFSFCDQDEFDLSSLADRVTGMSYLDRPGKHLIMEVLPRSARRTSNQTATFRCGQSGEASP